MGESFDHRPPGWIRQSCKCRIQVICSAIHNHMVVDFLPMSNANFRGEPEIAYALPMHRLLGIETLWGFLCRLENGLLLLSRLIGPKLASKSVSRLGCF